MRGNFSSMENTVINVRVPLTLLSNEAYYVCRNAKYACALIHTSAINNAAVSEHAERQQVLPGYSLHIPSEVSKVKNSISLNRKSTLMKYEGTNPGKYRNLTDFSSRRVKF